MRSGIVVAQSRHAKLLTAAARRILRPLGLQQRGRSRLWLDDHGWWVAVVEFQPSGWSKGSYLNVGAMWLWYEKEYFSFDYGSRVENFVQYKGDEQFAPLADNLVCRAAEAVARLRSRFPSVKAAAQQLATTTPMGFWDLFHAGVACGLAGETTKARQFFAEVGRSDHQQDWAQAITSLARAYSVLIDDLPRFRTKVEQVVRRARERLRLPSLAKLLLD